MKVTDEMIVSFLEALEDRGVPYGNVGTNDVRAGLEAALADVLGHAVEQLTAERDEALKRIDELEELSDKLVDYAHRLL